MGAVDVERQAPNVARMRLLGAEGDPGRIGVADAEGRHERGAARLGDERAHHVLLRRQRGGSSPLPALVAELQRVIGDEAREQCVERGMRRMRSSRASAAARTRSGCSARSWKDPRVALRRRSGGPRARQRAARGDAFARPGRRAARVADVRALRRRRTDPRGTFGERRARLSGRGARALALAGHGPRHVPHRDGRRGARSGHAGRTHGGHPHRARDGARLRRIGKIAEREAQARGRPARLLVCLSGRGDKDLDTLMSRRDAAPRDTSTASNAAFRTCGRKARRPSSPIYASATRRSKNPPASRSRHSKPARTCWSSACPSAIPPPTARRSREPASAPSQPERHSIA